MRRTPSSGCYWGFVLCLRDTLYLFLAIAIIAYALRQIKFTQLLYFLSSSSKKTPTSKVRDELRPLSS